MHAGMLRLWLLPAAARTFAAGEVVVTGTLGNLLTAGWNGRGRGGQQQAADDAATIGCGLSEREFGAAFLYEFVFVRGVVLAMGPLGKPHADEA